MKDKWREELFQCAEGLYIIEEECKNVVWMNPYLVEKFGADCIGKPCFKVLLGRDESCPFCPRLLKEDPVYEWEYYDPTRECWLKIKNSVFEDGGILYRAGNINMVNDMMQLNYEMVREVSELRKGLSEAQGELEGLTEKAIYDVLTGLYNRNCFERDLEQKYKNADSLGVLYLDLNNLKEINDEYRHIAGDILLKRVGAVLRRISSHVKNANCYRIGGDEFVMLAKCDECDINRCEELFHIYIEAYNRGEAYVCNVAVGKAFEEHVNDPEALVAKADKAMYRCKKEMKKEKAE